MKTITTYTDKGKRKVKIPQYWHEVTTRQYQRMVTEWDASDLVKLFSILTGIEHNTLSETKDPDLEQALIESVRFIYDTEPAFKNDPPPPYIEIYGKCIEIPKRLEPLSIGQSILVRQHMDKAKVFDELLSITMAIYLQPFYDCEAYPVTKKTKSGFVESFEERQGRFNPDRVEALHEKILDMPISDVYPVAFFLLKPLMKSGESTIARWLHTIIRLCRGFTESVGTLLRSRKFQGSNA